MINNFKKPNLKGPRYRAKRLGLLNAKTIKEFKEKNPLYSVIDNRDGVELPDSLGYLFIGTCPSSKFNTNYSLSNQYGKVLQNKNWDTDGNLGKIFYTNYSTKYRFKNRELWGFIACRDFKRSVAKSYPINWTKYLVMKNKYKVAHLYDENPEDTKKTLENYNEFEK